MPLLVDTHSKHPNWRMDWELLLPLMSPPQPPLSVYTLTEEAASRHRRHWEHQESSEDSPLRWDDLISISSIHFISRKESSSWTFFRVTTNSLSSVLPENLNYSLVLSRLELAESTLSSRQSSPQSNSPRLSSSWEKLLPPLSNPTFLDWVVIRSSKTHTLMRPIPDRFSLISYTARPTVMLDSEDQLSPPHKEFTTLTSTLWRST